MGRTLWVLRHAKAEPEPPEGGTDHERFLTPRGRRDARALGRRLAAATMSTTAPGAPARAADGPWAFTAGHGAEGRPEYVLSSSAARTLQTAAQVVAEWDDPPPVDGRRALYGASPEEVMAEIATVADDVGSLMVVGHNPTIHAVAYGLAAPEAGAAGTEPRAGFAGRLRRSFPTCALAVYRLPIEWWSEAALGTGRLLGLVTPPY